jgi:hypothetical protein
MNYLHAQILNLLRRADGKAYVDILLRSDGLYEFRGFVEAVEATGPNEGETYWSIAEHSGLYDTAERCEEAARLEVPWLRSCASRSLHGSPPARG